jgi:hypothetical protein
LDDLDEWDTEKLESDLTANMSTNGTSGLQQPLVQNAKVEYIPPTPVEKGWLSWLIPDVSSQPGNAPLTEKNITRVQTSDDFVFRSAGEGDDDDNKTVIIG